ncbi:hypothetical protein MPE84_03255 [Aeromonas veronii]|uniref:hypothetical protein n=1 Tax=Aeromonas veronii TaxID=654 RepID=UPI001FD6572D|nr:hypothetical protein [Aeromonas veronii]MCJ8233308.1 hypothetical protein [Aeromonas veronii]
MSTIQSSSRKMLWLPPLGYSPQFAAFNLIVLAVGHHALQHCYVLMAYHHVFISCKTTKQNFSWQKTHSTSPIERQFYLDSNKTAHQKMFQHLVFNQDSIENQKSCMTPTQVRSKINLILLIGTKMGQP